MKPLIKSGDDHGLGDGHGIPIPDLINLSMNTRLPYPITTHIQLLPDLFSNGYLYPTQT